MLETGISNNVLTIIIRGFLPIKTTKTYLTEE